MLLFLAMERQGAKKFRSRGYSIVKKMCPSSTGLSNATSMKLKNIPRKSQLNWFFVWNLKSSVTHKKGTLEVWYRFSSRWKERNGLCTLLKHPPLSPREKIITLLAILKLLHLHWYSVTIFTLTRSLQISNDAATTMVDLSYGPFEDTAFGLLK